MLNRPRGAGPFPVVILNHGYYPLDAYQTGNGTKLAADYLATRGFLTLSPDFRSHEIEFPVTPEQTPELYERLSLLGHARYATARRCRPTLA